MPIQPAELQRRLALLASQFDHYVADYDRRVPFTSRQCYWHRRTLALRTAAGSAAAAVESDEFAWSLHRTLRSWRIGTRASRLAELEDFAMALRACKQEVAEMDGWSIDSPALSPSEAAGRLWQVIQRLEIVDNTARLVACTKALHHLLPDLVVPMDRRYTQFFFGWHNPEFQYQQGRFFAHAFTHLAEVARSVGPAQYVSAQGWRTSRTRVLDNALIAFCFSGGCRPGESAAAGADCEG